MKIGLVDVDGHHFPNLALMKLSAWHKAQGDEVEWWQGNLFYYDRVYMSKVFSDAYSKENDDPINCGEVIRGGTGYCISLVDGKEVYDKVKDFVLPNEIEHTFPDYSIYPQFGFAVSMTSRGCPRGCHFCHVAAKEGRKSVKVADVSDYWNGQPHIEVLDPNITACKEKRELFRQYKETGATICFSQGLDIRLLDDADVDDINSMRIKGLHFAWDNPKDRLEERFKWFSERYRLKDERLKTVYVLTNYNSTMDENLHRIYTLRDLGYTPYVMVYNKPDAPKEIRWLQRWCNNKIVFRSVKRFEDYDPKKA